MNFIIKSSKYLFQQKYIPLIRSISVSTPLQLKNIVETQNGKELVIHGEPFESDRKPFLLQNPSNHACPICALGLDIKHTDVLVLNQFVRSDGCMLPRRITGLCKKQQKRMSSLVTMAHKAGLMPNLKPKHTKRQPRERYGWKKCNTYFDESTIKAK